MSKTSRPSGAANAPRFRTCASPHSWLQNPRIRDQRQVIRHHRHRPAKVRKRRRRHQLILQRHQLRHPPLRRSLQQRQADSPAGPSPSRSVCSSRRICLRRCCPMRKPFLRIRQPCQSHSILQLAMTSASSLRPSPESKTSRLGKNLHLLTDVHRRASPTVE